MASRRKAKHASPSRPAEGARRRRAGVAAPPLAPEALAKRTLAWGAGSLMVGLAVVGIGFDEVGMVPALVGLLLLVFGIHTFGRLGPEEGASPPEEHALDTAERGAWTGIWMGGLVAAAGLAVAFGSAAGRGWAAIVAYAAVFAGGFRLLRGLSGLSRVRKG